MNCVQVIERDTDSVANVSIKCLKCLKCLKCNHLFSTGVKSGLYRGNRAALSVCYGCHGGVLCSVSGVGVDPLNSGRLSVY